MNRLKYFYACLIMVLLFVSGGFSSVFAQNYEDELRELLDGHVSQVNDLLFSNLSFIRQTGDKNSVIAIQKKQEQLANYVNVEQLNQENTAYINQEGSGHGTRLLQAGIGNEASLWSVGSLSLTIAKQEGGGNIIYSYIDNQKFQPKGALLIQKGNNNSIEFALLGNDGISSESWPQATYIKQTGNDLEVSALFDSYEWPFYIEQQSGPDGEGMKVDVSTTDFYFPSN